MKEEAEPLLDKKLSFTLNDQLCRDGDGADEDDTLARFLPGLLKFSNSPDVTRIIFMYANVC